MRRVLLALVLVLAANDLVAVLDELANVGLLENLDARRVRLGEVFELLHQGVGDGHACGAEH